MRPLFYSKNSIIILSALLLSACQPPTDHSQSAITQAESISEKADADLSFIIDGDTITLSSDSILSIKSSRYQPSLGLAGKIEPIKHSRFVTAKAVTIKKVLVEEGQWVDKGTPLLIVQRQTNNESTATLTEKPQNIIENQQSKSLTTTSNPIAIEQAVKSPVESQAITNNQKQLISTANKTTAVTAAKTSDKSMTATSNATFDDDTQMRSDQSLDNNKRAVSETKPESKQQAKATIGKPQTGIVTVRASFSGRVGKLSVSDGDQIAEGTSLLQLTDDTHLQFIATLPIQAEPQLSVGQTVNFTAQDTSQKHTGQISKLTAGSSPDKLKVHVQVLKNEASRDANLKPNMAVTGRVNYGQIAVGTIVPERAIHDADISALKNQPYQPLTPLSANVWIIRQDQRLTRQPVEVIEYDPITRQYLIAGVNNDSLICLADLPIESAGKKVAIS